MFESLNPILGPAYFWIFSAVALLCALGVLLSRHPLNGALNLVGVMISLGGLYALLNAPFLAVLQVLVYAGAIMMLVVFVIMVLNKAKDHQVPRFDRLSIAGLGIGLVTAFVFVQAATKALPAKPVADSSRGAAEIVAVQLFDLTKSGPGYYVLFELIGVLLLVAVVAAVLLAKRHLYVEEPVEAEEDHRGTH
jgi:NADH-quinone oxidoreductase subunit J